METTEKLSPRWGDNGSLADVLRGDDFIFTPLTPDQKARNKSLDDRDEMIKEIRSLSFTESKKYFHREILQRQYPSYVFTDFHINILKHFHLWLWKGPSSKYDLKKGIYLIGHPGSGKTSIMQMMSQWSKILDRRPFGMMYAKAESDRAFNEKESQVLNKYFRGSWCIDEVGHEDESNVKAKVWGTSVSYIQNLLESRYQHRLITHGTSNKYLSESSPGLTVVPYEDRVISRMYAMFNVDYLNVKGKDGYIDFRKT